MKMPLVSILIPAFRPNWLDTAIASALTQTHQNCEILISDDCPTDEVRAVVSKWTDARIRYMRNPTRGLVGGNRDHLISQAKGSYLKFLFDDDFLMPDSIEMLLNMCVQHDAKLAFHYRHVVDEKGKLIESPTPFGAQGDILLTHETFAETIIKPLLNRIGEPSNILIHAASLKEMHLPFYIGNRRMRFLTDVALYTNFIAAGFHIAGTSKFGSSFRKHTQQTSDDSFPGFSAGVYEWELLRRWSTDKGLMNIKQYESGISTQQSLYLNYKKKFQELEAFLGIQEISNVDELMSKQFIDALQIADCSIDIRMLSKANKLLEK